MRLSVRAIFYTLICCVVWSATAPALFAEEWSGGVSEVVRAKVIEVKEESVELVPGTNTEQHVQRIRSELLEGVKEGQVVDVQNDYIPLKIGDTFFVIHEHPVGGQETFYVQDVDRRGSLLFLVAVCVLMIVLLGGWYGLRAFLALIASLFALGYVLIPGLASGWNPLLACFVVASIILAGMVFFTHGLNRESAIAYGGTLVAVVFSLLMAQWAVGFTHISGFAMEASVYLNFNTDGALDLVGLLIGGIVIGTLGVLDDIAITQVAIVREMVRSSPHMSRKEIFARAMRIGREHVGAVVNTLALAYIGVSLPLVLLFYLGQSSVGTFFNMEMIATEILRTVIGTMGIVMTVPLVTLLAVRFVRSTGDAGTVEHAGVHSHY